MHGQNEYRSPKRKKSAVVVARFASLHLAGRREKGEILLLIRGVASERAFSIKHLLSTVCVHVAVVWGNLQHQSFTK